jgi:DNA modification methylase
MITARRRSRRIPPSEPVSFPFDEPISAIEYGAVEQLPLDQLKHFPDNPRIHDEEAINTLARMIQATQIMPPLMVDADNRVLAGEGRCAAARLLGMKRVPVLRALNRSEAEMQAFRLADNRAVELGRWNDKLLAISIKGLADLKPNFNLEVTGWKQAEIDIKFQSLLEPQNAGDKDEVPEVPAQPVTRLGDLFLCGPHRILCGSALEKDDFARLMNGRLAAMIMQDPPYNVSVKKHVGGLGRIQHDEFLVASGELSRNEFLTFLTEQLHLNAEVCQPGGTLMSWMDWRSIDLLMAAGRACGLDLVNMCVWVKTNGSMGSLYRSKYELVCVFRKPGGKPINNVQLGKFGRYRTNVWTAPGANSFGADRMEELGSHPTPKNLDTFADAIRDVTHRDNIVLDCFLGSGTSLSAAERTGRVTYGMELEPKYVDVAILRWEKLTGRQAVLDGDGRTFAELAADRLRSN